MTDSGEKRYVFTEYGLRCDYETWKYIAPIQKAAWSHYATAIVNTNELLDTVSSVGFSVGH